MTGLSCDLCSRPKAEDNRCCPQHEMWRLEAANAELLEVCKAWHVQADAGDLDGVDLALLVATEDVIAKAEGE